MKERLKRCIPNTITLCGLVLCWVLIFVVIFYPESTGVMLALSTPILVSDWLDGHLARKWHVVSAFGAAADKARDKAYTLTMFAFICWCNPHTWLYDVAACLIALESGLLIMCFIGAAQQKVVSAFPVGKVKMWLESAAIVAYLVHATAKGTSWDIIPETFFASIILLVFVISVPFAAMSLQRHFVRHLSQI